VLTSSDLFKAFLKQVTEIADDTTNGRLFQSCCRKEWVVETGCSSSYRYDLILSSKVVV
jgi:hypothetical protein